MERAIVLLAFVAVCAAATTPLAIANNVKSVYIDGIPVEFQVPTTTTSATPFVVRTPTTPINDRIIYRRYIHTGIAPPADLFNLNGNANAAGENFLVLEGENLGTGPQQPRIILSKSGSCAGFDASAVADCLVTGLLAVAQCNLPVVAGAASNQRVVYNTPYNYISDQTNLVDRICLYMPVDNFASGAAFTGYVPGLVATQAYDTNLWFQVAYGCDGGRGSVGADTHEVPTATAAAPGFAPSDCNLLANLNTAALDTVPMRNRETEIFFNLAAQPLNKAIDWDRANRRLRTVCCGWRPSQTVNGVTLNKRYGICINPQTEGCCSGANDRRNQGLNVITNTSFNTAGTGKPFNLFQEKCCFGGDRPIETQRVDNTRTSGIVTTIRNRDDFCPCRISTAFNQPVEVNVTCEAWEACCTPAKFPDTLGIPRDIGSLRLAFNFAGRCYDPKRFGCCSTGDIFDSGRQQCCAINGVQSLDVPCPCADDAHCGQFQRCCKQTLPVPTETEDCTIYSNYQLGIVTNARVQSRCLGKCLDTRFQICCNGIACVDRYEQCCNNTCCNKFTSQCYMGQPGISGNRYNDYNVGVFSEVCSSVENLHPLRGVLAFFLPIVLLAAMFLGLAFTLFFAKKQNAINPLSGYEKAIVALSFLVIVFAWPLFFSPLYKYGVAIIWVAFFSLLSAIAGVKRLLPIALVVQVILLVYIFDPFAGNEILNLSYTRQVNLKPTRGDGSGTADAGVAYSGVFLSIMALWRGDGVAYRGARCTRFYDGYFQRDSWVEDFERRDFGGSKTTFGFCAREWFATLMIVEILMAMWVIILFVVTLVAFIKNVLVYKVIKQNPLHF
jgi:hypothetical protein